MCYLNDNTLKSPIFRWDNEAMKIADPLPRVTMETMPMVHMKPEKDFKVKHGRYIAPLYKTSTRAGVLSTTGMSFRGCLVFYRIILRAA